MSTDQGMNEKVFARVPEVEPKGMVEPRKDGREQVRGDALERTPELLFVCPVCEGRQIIERMKDKRRVRVFEDGKIEGSDPDGWDRFNCTYFCEDCRSIIRHEQLVYFKDRIHLGKWLFQDPEWELQEETAVSQHTYIDVSALLDSSGKKLKPGELPYVCPQCGASELDECWGTETPITLYQDGSIQVGSPIYDESQHHYRCRRCWCVLEDERGTTVTREALVDYLKYNAVNAG
jgi:hypothetical protein